MAPSLFQMSGWITGFIQGRSFNREKKLFWTRVFMSILGFSAFTANVGAERRRIPRQRDKAVILMSFLRILTS